jgi:Flp pilus assembly protein TadD
MRRLFALLLLAATPALAVLNDDVPEGQDPDLAEGTRAVRTGRYELGIPYLRAVLERAPNEPEIHVYLALALRQTGRAEDAARHYERALALDPDHKGALAYQGVLKLAQGDRAGAEANLARLRALCPQGCNERDDLARELARGG